MNTDFKKAFIMVACSAILMSPLTSSAYAIDEDDIVTVKKFGTVEKTEDGAVVEMGFEKILRIVPYGTGSINVTGYGESYVGGGKWTYGLSSVNLWSRFVNRERVHGTRVKNRLGVREHRGVAKGIHAIASIKKDKSKNYAYVYFN